MNIVDNILHQCRYQAPAVAICAPGTNFNLVSYARLEQFIHNVSRKAADLGLARGQIVALFVTEPVLHAALILGLTRLGVVTLSGRSPKVPPKELQVAAYITDDAHPYETTRLIRADANWLAGDGKPLEDERIGLTNPDDLCRIILTSGTTGNAKGVGLTHRMIADRIARHNTAFGNQLPQCQRTYCDLGFSTSLGSQFLIYMLWRGGTIFLPGRNLEKVVRALDAYSVQNIVSTPAGLVQYLECYEEQKSLQCNVEMIVSAGSMLSRSLSGRVRRRMCSNVFDVYGATETSIVATAPAHMLDDVEGAVGHMLPGMSIEIVDESGKVLPSEMKGVVRVRGPYSVRGYLGDPQESKIAFRDGWFYPGDIGSLRWDKLLVIGGRETTVMNLGGDKINPEVVEEVISSFPSVAQAGVFSVPNALGIEEIWALIVPRSNWEEKALRAHCEERLPSGFIPVRFVVVDALPRNAMGKLERRALPELAKAGRN